jgi:hypothetical protein
MYKKTDGVMYETMTKIYALNRLDMRNLAEIQRQINDILTNVDSLLPMFKGYYTDRLHRVRLVDILQYINTHITTHVVGSVATVEGQHIKMSALLKQLQEVI